MFSWSMFWLWPQQVLFTRSISTLYTTNLVFIASTSWSKPSRKSAAALKRKQRRNSGVFFWHNRTECTPASETFLFVFRLSAWDMYQLYMQILMLLILNMVQPLCEPCHSVRAVLQITLCLIGLFVAVCSRFLIAWGLGVNVILSLLSLNSGVCAPMKQA